MSDLSKLLTVARSLIRAILGERANEQIIKWAKERRENEWKSEFPTLVQTYDYGVFDNVLFTIMSLG